MRFRGKLAAFLVCLTFSVSCLASDAEPSAAGGQQELASVRLEQIKERLIEAAFGSGVNVRSVAYLDSSGALTQDAFFSSDIKVRGNQVISYLKELDGGQAIGRAELPLEKACDVWDAQEKREKGVVKVSTRVKTSRRVSENAIPESKRTELTALLDQILTNEGFNVVHGDNPSKVSSPQNTEYMRHLISDWALGPSADFEVNLELDLINTSTHIVPSVYSSHSMLYGPEVFLSNIGSRDYVLELSVAFSQPASRRLLKEETLSTSFVAQRHYASGAWSLGDRDRMIDQWVDDTVRSFVTNSQCLPQVFNVTPLPDGNFELSAGLAHGLSAGSWIVVASRNLMIGNEVSDATFDSLSIMRVSASNSYSAIAEPLASSIGQSNVRSGELTGMML
ncbi:MAG: hypothetical protein VW647_10970 [Alphaproteobacteria bacterium]